MFTCAEEDSAAAFRNESLKMSVAHKKYKALESSSHPLATLATLLQL